MELSKIRGIEHSEPDKALSIYKNIIRGNHFHSKKILLSGLISPLVGNWIIVSLTQKGVELSSIMVVLIFGIVSFVPPYLFHTWEQFKYLGKKFQNSSAKLFSGVFMFIGVFATPIIVAVSVSVGVFLLAGPFILLIKIILNQSFQATINSWLTFPFVILAMMISIAYMMSPKATFSSPFPLKILFKDAVTGFCLGYRKVFFVLLGFFYWEFFRNGWESGLNKKTLIYGILCGICSGLLLFRIDRSPKLTDEVNIYRVRVLTILGRRYQARYWLAETANRVLKKTTEEIQEEIEELSKELELKISDPLNMF